MSINNFDTKKPLLKKNYLNSTSRNTHGHKKGTSQKPTEGMYLIDNQL